MVRLALQVISILSTSKAGLELESAENEPEQKQPGKSSGAGTPGKGATPRAHLNKYFRLFLVELLKMFDKDRTLLDQKGSFIIR